MAQQNGPITTSQMVVNDGAIIQVTEQLKIMRDIYVKALDDIIDRAKVLDSSLVKMEGTLEQQQKKVQQVAVEAENLAHKDAEVRAEIESLTAKIAKLETELEKLRKAQQEAAVVTQKTTVAQNEQAQAIQQETQSTKNNVNAINAEIASREQHLRLLSKAIGSRETIAKNIADERNELKRLKDQQKSLVKQMSASERVDNAQLNRLANLTKRMTDLKTSISQNEIRLRQYSKESQSAENSGKNLELRLGMLRDAYRSLSDFRKSLPFGQEIKQQIDVLAPKVAEFNKSIKNFHDNVGNYPTGGGGAFGGTLQVFAGNLLTKAVEGIKRLARTAKEFVVDGINMAAKGEGIYTAFEKLNQPGLLANLREETRGTVNDLTLMQSAVRARNFSIPLNMLGSLLKFARQRAQETGESVEYLTNSIVNGLGRKSVLILDNLGISAERIRNEVAKSGNFMESVIKIVNEELEKQGELTITSADKAQQATTKWENAQLAVGRRLKWLSDLWASFKSDFSIGLASMMGELRDANSVYDDQVAKVAKLETGTADLVAEYTKLTSKSKLTKDEQKQLSKVTAQLAEAIPEAIEYTGQYGDEMAINIDKTKAYIEQQRALLLIMRQNAVLEATKNLKEYGDEIADLQRKLERAQKGQSVRIGWNIYWGDDAKAQAAGLASEISRLSTERAQAQALVNKFNSQGDNSTVSGLRSGLDEDVNTQKEFEVKRAEFIAMNKLQLEAWLKDEANAASRYAQIARSILEQKNAEDPELTEKQKRAAEKAARERERASERERRKQEQDASARLQLEKKAIENENAAMEKGYDQQVTATINAAKIREQEIQRSFDRITNKTDEDHKTYAQAMKDSNARLFKELNELQANHEIQQLEWTKKGLEMQLATAKKGSDEYLDIQLKQLQIEEQIALRRNALLPKDQQQNPDLISAGFKEQANRVNSSEQLERFDQQAALKMTQWEIDNTRATEEEKFRIRKQAEIDRWKEILRLNDLYGSKMAPEEIKRIKLLIQQGEYEVERSAKKKRPYNNFLDVIGLKFNGETQEEIRERQEAVMQAVNYTVDQLSSVFAAQEQLAQQAINQSQERIDAARSVLDAEREAAANGYANNVAQAQRELALQKQTQEKLLRQQAQMQRAQQAIEALSQTSSLITASANIWASFTGGTGLAGPFLAAAAIATMWASFAAAQIKAAQVTRQSTSAGAVTYGTGGYEYITGGSHQSGRDVSLGHTQDGRERRIEGGEFLGVINKQATRKYGSELGAIIDSINHGEFERIYMRSAFSFEKAGITINQNADTARLAADVAAIRRQGERQIVSDGKGRIFIFKGNNTKIIKS